MHLFGATTAARHSLRSRRRLSGSSPPQPPSSQYSVLSTSLAAHFRPIRRLSSHGAFQLIRASAPGDLGPGCYVLKTAISTGDITRAMLHREALVASQISHANLIPVLAAECDASIAHLVLPYLEGITLRRLLDSSQRLSISYALCVSRQIATALGAIHAAGWLHGQVRPEHIIISPQGHATLIDLTHARRLESSECDATDALPSWPVYAAPESASSHGRLIAASDMYSLGVVLYESLCVQPPFQHASPRELMRSHRRDAPPCLRELRTDVSLEVAELCHRLLSKEPLRRPSADQTTRWVAELEIAELALS